MTGRIISKIPIKFSAPLVLTTPVLVVTTALSVLAFIHGRSAVDNLMEQNLFLIHDRIEKRLDEFLQVPGRINRINAHLIEQRKLDIADVRGWRQIFVEQMQAFNMLSSVAWGGANGQAVWVARYPNHVGFTFGIKDNQTEGKVYEYQLDTKGEIEGNRSGAYTYDPRNRPWYKAASEADKPTWSDIYAWIHKDGSASALAIAFVQPLRNLAGELIGVIDAELSLHDISQFLEALQVGRTGRAFVIDRKNRLIASSSGTPITDSQSNQIAASESFSRDIAVAAKYLQKEFISLESVAVPYQFRLDVEEEPYLLMVSPFEHVTGLSWLIATLVPERDFMTEIEAGRRQSIAIGIAAVSITVLIGLVLALIAVRAILTLVGHVRRIGEGELDHDLNLKYTPEFVQLSNAINTMAAGLRDRMRLRHSLALAMEVQQSLLPSDTPVVEGLDIAGHSTYCDETGGDYYDFLDITGLSQSTVAIAIGDVVGHGVAAAMLMATARGILRSRCQEPGTLADLLTHMNDLLVADTAGERFMTMLLMTIDAKSGRARWATAGHEPPFAYDANAACFLDFKGSGFPLGLMEDVAYDEYHFDSVQVGQVYVAATDGVWETLNEKGEMFRRKRLRELIRRYAHLSADEISERIAKEVRNFRGESNQEDDLAFVVIKVLKGRGPCARSTNL